MSLILENIDTMLSSYGPVMELTFKKIVRDGKIIKKLMCPDGFKAEDGRCVRMQSAEVRKRQKAAKKMLKTKKKTFKGINKMLADKSRKKSLKLRERRGL